MQTLSMLVLAAAAAALAAAQSPVYQCSACADDDGGETSLTTSCSECYSKAACGLCLPFAVPALVAEPGARQTGEGSNTSLAQPTCAAISGCRRRGDRVTGSTLKLRAGPTPTASPTESVTPARDYELLGGCCRGLPSNKFGTFTEVETLADHECAFKCDEDPNCLAYEQEPVKWHKTGETLFFRCELHTAPIESASNGFHCKNGKKSCYRATCNGQPDPNSCRGETSTTCLDSATRDNCPIKCGACTATQRSISFSIVDLVDPTRQRRADVPDFPTIEAAITNFTEEAIAGDEPVVVDTFQVNATELQVNLKLSVTESAAQAAASSIDDESPAFSVSGDLMQVGEARYGETAATPSPSLSPTQSPSLSPTASPTPPPTPPPTDGSGSGSVDLLRLFD